MTSYVWVWNEANKETNFQLRLAFPIGFKVFQSCFTPSNWWWQLFIWCQNSPIFLKIPCLSALNWWWTAGRPKTLLLSLTSRGSKARMWKVCAAQLQLFQSSQSLSSNCRTKHRLREIRPIQSISYKRGLATSQPWRLVWQFLKSILKKYGVFLTEHIFT